MTPKVNFVPRCATPVRLPLSHRRMSARIVASPQKRDRPSPIRAPPRRTAPGFAPILAAPRSCIANNSASNHSEEADAPSFDAKMDPCLIADASRGPQVSSNQGFSTPTVPEPITEPIVVASSHFTVANGLYIPVRWCPETLPLAIMWWSGRVAESWVPEDGVCSRHIAAVNMIPIVVAMWWCGSITTWTALSEIIEIFHRRWVLASWPGPICAEDFQRITEALRWNAQIVKIRTSLRWHQKLLRFFYRGDFWISDIISVKGLPLRVVKRSIKNYILIE